MLPWVVVWCVNLVRSSPSRCWRTVAASGWSLIRLLGVGVGVLGVGGGVASDAFGVWCVFVPWQHQACLVLSLCSEHRPPLVGNKHGVHRVFPVFRRRVHTLGHWHRVHLHPVGHVHGWSSSWQSSHRLLVASVASWLHFDFRHAHLVPVGGAVVVCLGRGGCGSRCFCRCSMRVFTLRSSGVSWYWVCSVSSWTSCPVVRVASSTHGLLTIPYPSFVLTHWRWV